jgi:S1-C subfamily serine protease
MLFKKWFWIYILACILIVIVATKMAHAGKAEDSMLNSVVRIELGNGVGSGVVVSTKVEYGSRKTLVVTNYHVIASLLSKKLSPDHGMVELRKTMIVTWFRHRGDSEVYPVGRIGRIVKYNAQIDLALIQVDGDIPGQPKISVAHRSSRKARVMETIWKVGCALGLPVFPTEGIVSNPDHEAYGKSLIQHSAPTIFGDSGGGLFRYHNKRYELIGINEAVATAKDMPIMHIAVSIPMEALNEFLGF